MYLVTYQFQPPNPKAAAEIANALAKSRDWTRWMDSVWVIDTAETLEQLTARLMGYVTGQDRLLIVALNPANLYQGWQPQEFWAWMRSRSSKAQWQPGELADIRGMEAPNDAG